MGLHDEISSQPVASLIEELGRASAIIASVDDVNYCRRANGSGSVGAQVRHNLDFVDLFVKGVRVGRVDYGARERDLRIENDRIAAFDRIEVLQLSLEQLDKTSLLNTVSVRSEIDDQVWLPSSVLRELEFVHSHTVHHHALIAEKLIGFGIAVQNELGVAPSTLKYWKHQAA